MPVLNIRIQSLEDAKNGMQTIPGVDSPEKAVECQQVTAVIMEGGMSSGATSIMLVLQREGDKPQYGEISGKLFEMLYSAYRGAQIRWGQRLGNVTEDK